MKTAERVETIASALPPVALVEGTRSGPGLLAPELRPDDAVRLGARTNVAGMMAIVQLMHGRRHGDHVRLLLPARVADDGALHRDGHADARPHPLGFVMLPSGVTQQRTEGTFEFIWSLPAPRSAQAASTFVLFTALSVPGMVLALLVAVWRYGIHLSVSPAVVPAALVSALVSVTVGFGMALAIRSAVVMNLITNSLVFLVLLFSPIVYPASNLPTWFQKVHEVLPFEHMAAVIRAGLTDGLVSDVVRRTRCSWRGSCGCAMTAFVVGRRR